MYEFGFRAVSRWRVDTSEGAGLQGTIKVSLSDSEGLCASLLCFGVVR